MKRKGGLWPIFWGLFFLCAAGLIVASQLGYVTGMNLFSLVMLILMVAVVIQSLRHFNFFGVFFPIAILGIIFADPLGITAIVPWTILIAALFLSIGFSILFRKKIQWAGGHYDGHWHGEWNEITENTDENNVAARVTFSGVTKYLHSPALERVQLSASFGTLKVYFDQAQLSENGAEVQVECSFGEIVLYVPRNWRVVDHVQASFGDFKNSSLSQPESAPTLRVGGSVSFGDVKVIPV